MRQDDVIFYEAYDNYIQYVLAREKEFMTAVYLSKNNE